MSYKDKTMCSIFGIGIMNGACLKEDKYKILLDALFVASQIRGRAASGVCFTSANEMKILKGAISAEKFIKTEEYRKLRNAFFSRTGWKRSVSVIGHCRLPTKGSPKDNNNNHPIAIRNLAGVHNGIISNDDYLYETTGWPRHGEVDSEVIFRLLDTYDYEGIEGGFKERIQGACKNLTGTYACAFVDSRHKYLIWLFRNTQPIHIIYFKRAKLVVFASNKQFIKAATTDLDLGEEQTIEIPVDSAVGLDLYSKKYIPFKIPNANKQRGDFTIDI